MKIICKNCGWKWNTDDSDISDQYLCHKCNTDNTPLSLKKIYEQLEKKYKIDDIKKLVSSRDIAAIRAVLRIYLFQTKFEQQNDTTIEKNKVGFRGSDTKSITPIIKQIDQIGWINPNQLKIIQQAALRYSGQIAVLLNNKNLIRGNTKLDQWVDNLANKWNKNKDKNFVGLGLSFRYKNMRPQSVIDRIPKEDVLVLSEPDNINPGYYLINKKYENLPNQMGYNNHIIIPEDKILDFIQYAKKKPIFLNIKKKYNL